MCIAPITLDNGAEVACRNCWQCKRNRVNDLVGRCIAESRFSVATYAVTLTYAETAGVNSVTLVYKDVQDFLKRLRKQYKVRYICAGEYGTKKGRAHWHIVLFFKDKAPEVKQEARVDWKYWPHGFSYFQKPDWKGFQYVLKYTLKDADLDSHDSHLAMSKKPPLGAEFFEQLAKNHVEQAIVPRSYKYKISGVRKDNGTEKEFMMQGVTRDNFMAAFKEGYLEKYGKEPVSEFFDEWDNNNYEVTYTDEELVKRLHHKDVMYVEPWKNNHIEDNSMWYEVNYQGIDLIMHEKDGEAWIYTHEGQQWHEKRHAILEDLKAGTIKRRRFVDVQRETRESWVLSNEGRHPERGK